MSLLSSTQGTPERVWSLIAAVSAGGGEIERGEAMNWLNPGFTKDGSEYKEKSDAFAQTLGAATSLGAVEAEKGVLRVGSTFHAEGYLDFADWTHDRLVALSNGEKDAVILETYAWMAVESDRQGSIGWVHDWTRDAFADAADKALPEGADDDGQRRINTTKLPAWRGWLLFLGLLVPMPASMQPHPSAEARAARELGRASLPRNREILAEAFLKALAARLPYLDGGRMFVETTQRIGYAPAPGRLSPLMSATLRGLHDEGLIELRLRGDAGSVVRLTGSSTHKVQSFHAVVVKGGET